MNRKSFLIFTAVTVVVAAAAIAVGYSSRPAAPPRAGAKLFPQFEAQATSIQSLTVTQGSKTVTINRTADGWVIADKNNFPAQSDLVRKAVVALSEMQTFEPKTIEPARYDKLQVEDPAGKDAKSKLLTFKDKDGKVLASVIVGRANTNAPGGQERVYVRKPDDKQAWLATGDPAVKADVADWMDKALVDIKGERVKEVTLTTAANATMTVAKAKLEDKDYALANVPEGRKTKEPRIVGAVAVALDDVVAEDAKPIGEVDFTKNKKGTAVVKTFDGVTINVEMVEVEKPGQADKPEKDREKEVWAKISASFDEAAALKEKPKDSKLLLSAEAKAQVDAVNKRGKDWAYRLNRNAERYLNFVTEDLLEEKKEEKKDETKPGDKKDDDKK